MDRILLDVLKDVQRSGCLAKGNMSAVEAEAVATFRGHRGSGHGGHERVGRVDRKTLGRASEGWPRRGVGYCRWTFAVAIRLYYNLYYLVLVWLEFASFVCRELRGEVRKVVKDEI